MAKVLKSNWIIVLILCLSFFLRFYKISSVPYSMDGDEAAFGYYGYSLIHNLSDEYGKKLPLYFSSIGDYKYPVYAYLSTVPVGIFGLSEFSTRFTSALLGSFFPLLIYFLINQIFKNKKMALVGGLMSAISPYGIMFSRGAYEANVGLFFVTLGIILFLKSSYWSILPFILAAFSYSADRIFIIAFIITSLLINRTKKVLIITGILIVLIGAAFLDKRSLIRANEIGFTQPNYLLVDIQKGIWENGMKFSGKYLFLTRLFNNKPLIFLYSFGERYLEHLNPVYLFATSNPNMPKYSIPAMGLFYAFEFITVLAGIYWLSSQKSRYKFVPIIIILISVISSALTIETPNPIRSLMGLSGWIMLSTLGIYGIYENAKFKKIHLGLFGVMVIIFMGYFLHQYFITDVYRSPWYSDGGVNEMVSSVNELKGKYDKVVINGDPYIFFLFYGKVSPKVFIANSTIMPEVPGQWERVESFQNIIFKMPTNCPKIGRLRVLYVCKGAEIPINSKLIKAISFIDKSPAFNLIEFVPYSQRQIEKLPTGVSYMVESDLSYNEGLLPENSGRYW